MLRKAIIVVMMAIPTLLLAVATDQTASIADRDFMAYWASGHLLAAGENPYDRAAVLKLEREQGFDGPKVYLARNPPWTLWWMLPLGLLTLKSAWVLWMAICVFALTVSIHICWRVYGYEDADTWSLCLLGTVGFAPVLACLMAGQTGILLLLGLVLFLYLERTHEFWAGFALILPLAKPHLLAPFLLVVVIWTFRKRKWSVVTGFASAVCAVMIPALIIDPRLLVHYRAGIMGENIGGDFIPTLSGVLRALVFPDMLWVQFVPVFGGLIWAVWFYSTATSWDWRTHGLAVLVASVLVTPYAWFSDEAILLPVVLSAGLQVNSRKRANAATWGLLAASVGLLLMVLGAIPITSGLYFWSGLTWAGWYWLGHSGPQLKRVLA